MFYHKVVKLEKNLIFFSLFWEFKKKTFEPSLYPTYGLCSKISVNKMSCQDLKFRFTKILAIKMCKLCFTEFLLHFRLHDITTINKLDKHVLKICPDIHLK